MRRRDLASVAGLAAGWLAMPATVRAWQVKSSDEALDRVFGVGRDIALATATRQQPYQTQRRFYQARNMNVHYYSQGGTRVVVLATGADPALVPLEVSLSSPQALAAAGPDIARLTRRLVEARFGKPLSRSSSTLRYRGLAEICEDFVEFGFIGQALASVKWTFCVD